MQSSTWRLVPQKGEDPEALAAKKRELETKRAAAASKSTKTFYKVTVKVRILWCFIFCSIIGRVSAVLAHGIGYILPPILHARKCQTADGAQKW